MNGTLKLVRRETNVIPFKVNPCLHGSLIHVFDFIYAELNMLLNRIGGFNIVGFQNYIHIQKFASSLKKTKHLADFSYEKRGLSLTVS